MKVAKQVVLHIGSQNDDGDYYAAMDGSKEVHVISADTIKELIGKKASDFIDNEILSGTLRGIGDSWLPMIICCLGICVLRVVWILTAVPLKNDILTIVFSYPLTWTVTSIAFIVYYVFFSRLKTVGRKR